ncbi:hypothetical protein C3433_09280 [Citrobacter freundii]|nr:hypothetical protein C3433_09280 [Citrobacter freundii]
MITLCDRWLAQSPRFRLVCWCGWMLSLIIAVLQCLSATRQQRVMQQEALSQQRTVVQAQWRNLYLLVASPEEPEETLAAFSPLRFQTPLVRLLHWQPSALGGEMTLKPDWDGVPPMFVQLAEQGMNVNRFSLSAEGTELLLTLQLERLNDG